MFYYASKKCMCLRNDEKKNKKYIVIPSLILFSITDFKKQT